MDWLLAKKKERIWFFMYCHLGKLHFSPKSLEQFSIQPLMFQNFAMHPSNVQIFTNGFD
jgi:hypothetical protein